MTSPDPSRHYPIGMHPEPMTLGSPPSPPTGTHTYLPGYLMGDSAASGSSGGGYQTSQYHHPIGRQTSFTSPVGSGGGLYRGGGGQLAFSQYQQSPRTVHSSAGPQGDRARRQAPPTASLWAATATPPPPTAPTMQPGAGCPSSEPPPMRHSTPHYAPQQLHSTPLGQASVCRAGMFASPGPPVRTPLATPGHLRPFKESTRGTMSPAQMDPFYTQGESLRQEDILDDTWITIFGYPNTTASFILQQFAQYGIIDRHVIANEGNWMHIKYQSKLQAKKALSKNGKVFGDSIMVGVQPCIDTRVMQQHNNTSSIGLSINSSLQHPVMNTTQDAQQRCLQEASAVGSPLCGPPRTMMPCVGTTPLTTSGWSTAQQQQVLVTSPGVDVSLNSSSTNKLANSSMRSLTAAYRHNNSILTEANDSQHNNSSFLSKAMGYMFGWA